jgi:Domain of unknown function (DUF4386)
MRSNDTYSVALEPMIVTLNRNRTAQASPQIYARIGGVLYLVIILAGGYAELFARSKLIVSGDAAATANNIMASESVWRIAFAGELVMLVCDVVVALILYVLLKPVDKNLALLAAFFRLIHVAIYGVTGLSNLAALLILGGGDYLTAFQPHQQQALALLFIKLHGEGYDIALVFFGFQSLFLGYLIFRSGYLPRVLGILMIVASLCYLTNSFASILDPLFQAILSPGILLPVFVAETSLSLWLTVKGVNIAKWEERATG